MGPESSDVTGSEAPLAPRKGEDVPTKRLGVGSPERGWTLLFEWPYCFVCREYAPEHRHGGYRVDSGYWRPSGIPSQDGPVADNGEPTPDWPYQVLGVAADAGPDVIRSAYRKWLLRTHPDKGGTEEEVRRVIAAYDELKARRRVD